MLRCLELANDLGVSLFVVVWMGNGRFSGIVGEYEIAQGVG